MALLESYKLFVLFAQKNSSEHLKKFFFIKYSIKVKFCKVRLQEHWEFKK